MSYHNFTLPSFLSFPMCLIKLPFYVFFFYYQFIVILAVPGVFALGRVDATFHFLSFGLGLISWPLDLISALFWNCLLVFALIPCLDLFLSWHALYFYCHDSVIAESAPVPFIPMFKYTIGTHFVLIYYYLIIASFFQIDHREKKR